MNVHKYLYIYSFITISLYRLSNSVFQIFPLMTSQFVCKHKVKNLWESSTQIVDHPWAEIPVTFHLLNSEMWRLNILGCIDHLAEICLAVLPMVVNQNFWWLVIYSRNDYTSGFLLELKFTHPTNLTITCNAVLFIIVMWF